MDSEARRYEAYLKDEPRESLVELYDENLRALRLLTVDTWLEGLARIKHEKLTRDSIGDLSDQRDGDLVLRHMLRAQTHFYGYPGDDCRHVVRLALEGAVEEERLVYDLSDLVVGGWIGEAEDLVKWSESLMEDDLLLHQRVIVLTEGKTDKRILERSLSLLYPHLAEYFHFFDFDGEGGKVPGGAGPLAHLVRAFAAADVRHRVVALFDNDTAGRSAVNSLKLLPLPKTLEVRHYPDLELARNYPTIGPSGPSMMDVNGMAAGLELYLGEDVLSDGDGLRPVQWKGYNDKTKTYQGEVTDKRGVQEGFRRKIERCESNPGEIELHDWQGVRLILDTIFTAFHDSDARRILAEAD